MNIVQPYSLCWALDCWQLKLQKPASEHHPLCLCNNLTRILFMLLRQRACTLVEAPPFWFSSSCINRFREQHFYSAQKTVTSMKEHRREGESEGAALSVVRAQLSLCSFSYLPLHQASATPYQTLQCWETPWGDTKKGEEVRDLGYFSWALRVKGSLGKVFAEGPGSLVM